MTEPQPEGIEPVYPGLVSYRIGGRTYAQRLHGTCLVCRSRYRFEVEASIAEGLHFTSISRQLPDEAELSAASIRTHYLSNHMPMRQAALRRIVEDRQVELGRVIEEGVEPIADQVSFARSVVDRTFSRIASGEVEPTVAEGIAAARLLQQFGVDDNGIDKSAYTEAFIIYMQTAQQVMSDDQFTQFSSALSGNPVLKALVNRSQQQSAVSSTSDTL